MFQLEGITQKAQREKTIRATVMHDKSMFLRSINRKTKSTFLTDASIFLVKQFVHHHDQHSDGSAQDKFTT